MAPPTERSPRKPKARIKPENAHRFRDAAKRRLLAMRAGHIVAWLGILGVLIVARPPTSEPEWLLAPFTFQEPGQPPLLLLRCGILFFSLYALRNHTTRAFLVVFAFLLSLGVRGALYPYVFLAAGLSLQRLVTSRGVNTVFYGSVVGAALLLVLPHLRAPPAEPDPRDPAKMVAHWQARKNPYQARWWAVQWAKQEALKPGEGLLTLARLDWQLGRQASARKMLTKLVDHAGSDAAREEALTQLATWDRESPAEEPSEGLGIKPGASSEPRAQ